MLRQITFVLALLTVCMPGDAKATALDARCDLHIVATPANWKIDNVDVFGGDLSHGAFEFQLVNDGGAPCRVRLGVDLQGAPYGLASGGSKRVAYSLTDVASGNDLTPRTGRARGNSRSNLVVAPNSELLTRFDAIVLPEFETDGKYSQTLFIEASNIDDGSVLAQKAITLSAEVAPSATIALSGDFTRSGGMADVDLGDLHQGDVDSPIVMHIRSTRAYRIRSSSEHQGRLVQEGTAWSVPYQLIMDSVTVSSANGTYTAQPGNVRRSDNVKLGFVITGDTNVAAGRYSDVITLEIGVS